MYNFVILTSFASEHDPSVLKSQFYFSLHSHNQLFYTEHICQCSNFVNPGAMLLYIIWLYYNLQDAMKNIFILIKIAPLIQFIGLFIHLCFVYLTK